LSHLPERKEKNCLNCGTEVISRFCHNCGQENLEPKETVWHLITHFFNDITHFDGKIFSSLKYLIFRPGFLSKEYMLGKRARYLNPVRMYLLTSAIFFLIFFSLFTLNDATIKTSLPPAQVKSMDSAGFNKLSKELAHDKILSSAQINEILDSNRGVHFTPTRYKSRVQYDSLLKAGVKQHNWIEKQLVYKEFQLNEKYNRDQKLMLKSFLEKFIHSLPQMLFVLLPLLALILKLLYIRRKQFYYVDHSIFTIHLYVFVFIALLIIFGINKLQSLLHWGVFSFISSFISGVIVIIIFFYIYKAMRNFYRQGRGKTILKYIILLFSFLVIAILLFLFFGAFSMFSL
jgi:Protein of unknown function (DUF3667)